MTGTIIDIKDGGAWSRERPASSPKRIMIEASDVGKTFAGRTGPVHALSGIDLQVEQGDFITILGRSGCGKSTLLRLFAGLLLPTTGRIDALGVPVLGPPPEARYVFQDYGNSLFPWRNVLGNVMFGAASRGGRKSPRSESKRLALESLDLVGLAHVAKRYPRELSGGMQQRVAIARAIASDPSLLLMDEPFGAVDALSRSSLQDAILDLWHKLNLTVLLVTHDIDEAVYLSQRVIVLDPAGRGVAADIAVDLPWPRHQIDTRERPAFNQLRRRLTAVVNGEV